MKLLKPAASLALVTLLALAATDAGARDRQVKRANGTSHTRTVEVQRTEDGYTRTMEGTTGNGKTFRRDTTFTADKESGTWTKEVTGTTPNGKTYATTVNGQKTDSGYTRSAVHTGVNGGTTTRNTTATKTASGWTKTVETSHARPQNGDAPAE